MQIYVHIPFCKRKCNYCDFCSQGLGLEVEYVDALIDEIKIQSKIYGDKAVDTIYFGGGTPSVLPVGLLKKIVNALEDNFCLQTTERSIEGNPESLTENMLNGIRDCGFNRISIGVQSLDDEVLKTIGRLHDSKAALKAIGNAIDVIGNVSVDMMLGLPKQTITSSLDTAKALIQLDIKHISCYALKLEENTPLSKSVKLGELVLPSDDVTADMFEQVSSCFQNAKFARYEVSNFAKAGFLCQHNIGYWDRKEYLGLGASAHSLLNETRFSNVANVEEYIDCVKNVKVGKQTNLFQQSSLLSCAEIRFEKLMLGLRKVSGVPKDFFDGYEEQLQRFAEFFQETTQGNIALTERGFEVMNSILCEFI